MSTEYMWGRHDIYTLYRAYTERHAHTHTHTRFPKPLNQYKSVHRICQISDPELILGLVFLSDFITNLLSGLSPTG